jgi:hypothetical protein
VLKSIWLEGKRNQHIDHLIHTLVMEFLPDLEFCHKWQTLGMEGPNLAEKHHQQILMHTPETPLTKIERSTIRTLKHNPQNPQNLIKLT